VNTYNYIILGAGPAGLSFAYTLLQHGEKSFIILEKEDTPGGLCRSKIIDGSPLDIGGGHFLDTTNQIALDFVFKFLNKDEWNLHNRKSTILLGDIQIDYPIESNIWQFPIMQQIDYLESIAYCGANLKKHLPKSFNEWIIWKLGERIAEDYMIPYNKKIWSIDLNELGTYWMNKLPDVSFRETLLSCLNKTMYGKIPAHKTFFYPKEYGYGEVWKRIGDALGNKLISSTTIESLNFPERVVNNQYKGGKIINTVPWDSIQLLNIPKKIVSAIKSLKHSSIQIDYYMDSLDDTSHWIYVPNENYSYHRILNRKEFFFKSKGYWTETNTVRTKSTKNMVNINEYAYPLNTLTKQHSINTILSYASMFDIYGLGRWGTWEHINSDIAVQKGIELAETLINK